MRILWALLISGPIYDYSFISTTKEFTKIYGEPTTEAEKFLFTAVQSVLENGGTPVIARLPYDNKQCQAYKALKMKWIDKTDLISPKIDSDLATPLVPLDEITKELDTERPLSKVFAPDAIAVDGVAMSGLADTITVRQAVMLLNPYETGSATTGGEIYDEIKSIAGLTINGVAPSSLNVEQTAVKSAADSLKTDTVEVETRVSMYNDAYTKIETETSANISSSYFITSSSEVTPYRNVYLCITNGNDESKNVAISLYEDVTEGTYFNGFPVTNTTKISATNAETINAFFTEQSSLSGTFSVVETMTGRGKNMRTGYYEISGLTSGTISSLVSSFPPPNGRSLHCRSRGWRCRRLDFQRYLQIISC